MTGYTRTNETDSPAPILRVVKPRIGWGNDSIEQPETAADRAALRLRSGLPRVYRGGSFAKANEARRYANRKAAA